MNAWTYRITNNGREVENLDAGTYATEAEARKAGEAALDDCCPPGSKNRSAYRLEVYAVRFETLPIGYPPERAAAICAAIAKAEGGGA